MRVTKPVIARRMLVVAVASAALLRSARGEVFRYDNENELRGAAMLSPEAPRRLLTKLMGYCGEHHPTLRDETSRALEAWKARHAAYAAVSARIREEFAALATDPSSSPALRAEARKAQDLIAQMAAAADAQGDALLAPLRVAEENGLGERMCREYVRAIDDGKMDLKNTSPQLSKFFDGQLQKK